MVAGVDHRILNGHRTQVEQSNLITKLIRKRISKGAFSIQTVRTVFRSLTPFVVEPNNLPTTNETLLSFYTPETSINILAISH